MEALLYANLTKRTLSERLGGSAYSFPKLVQGDKLHIALRLAHQIDGSAVEISRVVSELRATMGRIDARPTSGTFSIKLGAAAASVGANTTSPLAYNITAANLQTALNALSGIGSFGAATVTEDNGSFLVSFAGATAATAIEANVNTLYPISFVRVRAYETDDNTWVNEIRLIQAPIAFTDAHDRVVPPAPTITAVQDGGSSGDIEWPEIQALYIPPEFRGTYQIRRGLKKSTLLSIEDGPEEIAAAIVGLADDDSTFTVTNPANNIVHIQFDGEMNGVNQDLLTIEVFSAPEGDITFTLDLGSAELAAFLRASDEATVPFEIELDLEDLNNSAVVRTYTVYKGEIKLYREVGWQELGTPPNIDWLQPPTPKDYTPYETDQVITGSQHYTTTLGNGSATTFVVTHGLNTDSIHITVRANAAGGAVYVLGTDYTATVEDDNSVEIVWLGAAPAAGALAITITSAGPIDAFQAHNHTIAQVTGLQTILDALDARLTTVEGNAAVGSGGTPDASAGDVMLEIALPKMAELYPMRTALSFEPVLVDATTTKTTTGAETEKEIERIADIPRTSLPKDGGLLPAIHDAASAALASPVPQASTSNAGQVFQNRTLANVTIRGGGGRSSYALKPGEFCASDGRYFYPVIAYGVHNGAIEFTAATDDTITFRDPSIQLANGTPVMCKSSTTLPAGLGAALTQRYVIESAAGSCKLSATVGGSALDVTDTGTGTHYLFATEGTVTSWYPRDFERELFICGVNSDALLVGRTAEVKFGIDLAILNAKTAAPRISDKVTRAHWRLKIEWGTHVSEASPATTGRNIRKIVWNSTPILEKTLLLTNDTPTLHTFGARVERTAASTYVTKQCKYGVWTASSSAVNTADFFIRATLSEFDVEDVSDARGVVALVGLSASLTSDASIGKLIVS